MSSKPPTGFSCLQLLKPLDLQTILSLNFPEVDTVRHFPSDFWCKVELMGKNHLRNQILNKNTITFTHLSADPKGFSEEKPGN